MHNLDYRIPSTDDFLSVDYEYEAAQHGGFDDPSYPAAAYVVRVSANGIDITSLLSNEAIEHIEQRLAEEHI